MLGSLIHDQNKALAAMALEKIGKQTFSFFSVWENGSLLPAAPAIHPCRQLLFIKI